MIKNINERRVPQKQGHLTPLQPGAPLIPDKWRHESTKNWGQQSSFQKPLCVINQHPAPLQFKDFVVYSQTAVLVSVFELQRAISAAASTLVGTNHPFRQMWLPAQKNYGEKRVHEWDKEECARREQANLSELWLSCNHRPSVLLPLSNWGLRFSTVAVEMECELNDSLRLRLALENTDFPSNSLTFVKLYRRRRCHTQPSSRSSSGSMKHLIQPSRESRKRLPASLTTKLRRSLSRKSTNVPW